MFKLRPSYCRSFVFLVGFVLFSFKGLAQPARNNYQAFVIRVNDAQSGKLIDDISLCFYDQTGKPLVQWVQNQPLKSNKKAEMFLDSFYCWPNHRTPIKQVPDQIKFFQRQSFPVLNKEWVCVFPAFSGDIDLLTRSIIVNDISEINESPRVPMFLQLKIHDPKGRYADALIPIPKDRCFFVNDLKQGHIIEPIRLVLSKTEPPRLLDESYASYWYPVYAIQRNQNMMLHDESNTPMILLALNAYHEETGNVVKQVLSPKSNSNYGEWGRGNLQFYKQAQKTFIDYPDFFVPRKHHTVGLFYTFSEEQKTYVIDSAVYTKPNLRYSAHLKKLFADDTLRRGAQTCRLTYTWENRAWHLVQDTCFLLPEKPVDYFNPKASDYIIIQTNRPGRVFPLRVFESDTQSIILYDTFYVSNPTNRKVKFNVVGMQGTSVKMPRSIEANSTIPCYVQFTLRPNNQVLHTYSGGLYIQFGANQTLSYYLTAPTMAKGTLQTKANQEWHFYNPINKEKLFFLATDTASAIKAYGYIQASDSLRIGSWHFYDVERNIHSDTVYSKALRLFVADAKPKPTKVLLYFPNKICDTVHFTNTNSFNFNIRGPLDSMVLLRDSFYGLYMPRYDMLVDGMSQYVPWLKPNQDYYIQQGVYIPVDFNHEQYYIQWNAEMHARQFKSEKALHAFEIENLKRAFPAIRADTTGAGDYYINLDACSETERQNIQDYVLKIRRAKAMCKLHRPAGKEIGLLFALPRITVYSPTDKLNLLNQEMAQFGYEFIASGGVSEIAYIYEAKWPLVNEAYYKQFNTMLRTFPQYRIVQAINFRVKPVFDLDMPKR